MNEEQKTVETVDTAALCSVVYHAGYRKGIIDVLKKSCEITLMAIGVKAVVSLALRLAKAQLNKNSTTEEVDPT